MREEELKNLLDSLVHKYNRIDFIENDPISIPHQYHIKQDIEIAAFIAAIFSWGQRVTIINKCKEFFSYMDNAPYQFVLNHQDKDLKPFLKFRHRTFNDIDALYFISFLKHHYAISDTLETAFVPKESKANSVLNVEPYLINFKNNFFSLNDYPDRTKKHISSPESNATCKRLNMFLRWMVRNDKTGVDFGLWKTIKPSELICPIDVHVYKVSNQLGLLEKEKINWKTAVLLTEKLKMYDPIDPIKYDFALFGLGVEQKNI